MILSERKKDLLSYAYSLAEALARKNVGRSQWGYVLDALYRQELSTRSVQDLVNFLQSSSLAKRSDKTEDQMVALAKAFSDFWQRHISPSNEQHRLKRSEIRFVFGWADRFLYLRDNEVPIPELHFDAPGARP